MQKLICVSIAVLMSACGGRVAIPVEAENSFDVKLSCGHLLAELENNDKRIFELTGKSSDATRDNLGRLAISAVSPANILFLDVSDTHKKETEALLGRNTVLVDLMDTKSCDLPPNED